MNLLLFESWYVNLPVKFWPREYLRLRRIVGVPLFEGDVAIRAVPPQFVLEDEAAGVGVGVVPAGRSVHLGGTQRSSSRQAERDLVVLNVVPLRPVALIVLVDAAVVGVAPRLAHQVREETRRTGLRAVAGGADRHLVERAVVAIEREPHSTNAGVGDDAFDERALLAGDPVHVHGEHGHRGAAADVELGDLHARRRREQRPEVARPGRNGGQQVLVERGRHLGGLQIDHRCCARDRDRLFEPGEADLDVNGGREPDRDANTFAPHGGETGQLIRDGVFTGRDRREAILAFLVGDRVA